MDPTYKGQTFCFAFSQTPKGHNTWVYSLRLNKNEFTHRKNYHNSDREKNLLKRWTSLNGSVQFLHYIDVQKRFFADFGVYGEYMFNYRREATLSEKGRKGTWKHEHYLENFPIEDRVGLNTAIGMFLTQKKVKSFIRFDGQIHLPFYSVPVADDWKSEGWDLARIEFGIQL